MDISTLISHKKALLEAAKEKVLELERQISTLETIASEDDVDAALAGKIKPVPSQTQNSPKRIVRAVISQDAVVTATGRNPKGSIRSALLCILSDGKERDLDYIEQAQYEHLPAPIKRAALRNALMMLKNGGEIISRKNGYFQLAHKEESPGATGL